MIVLYWRALSKNHWFITKKNFFRINDYLTIGEMVWDSLTPHELHLNFVVSVLFGKYFNGT